MAKTKTKKVEKIKPVEPVVDPFAPVVSFGVGTVSVSAPILPIFENARVVAILSTGEKFNHCKMSDGTTKHVPVELF